MRPRRLRGLRRLQCARRVAVQAVAVCCVMVATLALPSASLLAQTSPKEQEIGTTQWGKTVVWFHATDAGQVALFASTGFRSAFVQPVMLSAEDADRWATLLDQLATAGASASANAGSPSDTSHVVLGDGDLVLVIQPAGISEPQIHAWVGATRADGVVAVIGPQDATQGARMLRDATRAARALRNAAMAAAAPPARESISVPSAAPTDLAATQVRPVAPAPQPAAMTVAVSERTTTVVGFESPSTSQPARTPHAHATALPVVRTTTTTTPTRLAAPALATITTVNRAPQHEHEQALATPVVAHTTKPTPPRTAVATTAPASEGKGIDDVMVQNLVAQWRPDLMYCYTQYGLREHTALAGTVLVRFALSPNGAVGHSVIGSRSWNGTGGTDVETCIRTRVDAWHFPPASAGSMHEFSLEFAPGKG